VSRPKLRLSVANLARLPALADHLARRHGRVRDIVIRAIRAGRDPAPEDVAAALREPPPDPRATYRIALSDHEARRLEHASAGEWRAWRDAIDPERRQAAIDAAREAIEADTRVLLDYVARTYVLGRARRPGPKRARRTLPEDLAIAAAYFAAREKNRRRRTDAAIKRQVAARFGISSRTLEAIIRNIRAKIN
jgi:hypothetical protein